MKIHVAISPQEFQPERYRGTVTAVIDALRATSTIVTALHNGCVEVIPVVELDEAFLLARKYPRERVLIGGERGGNIVAGFDLGNSPLEYTPEKVSGKTIILSTTNGTRALRQTSLARETLVLSFLNMSAVAAHLQHSLFDLHILCAGRDGEPGLEDTVCAGLLIDALLAKSHQITMDESAEEPLALARQHKSNLPEMMLLSLHGSFLESAGYGADLAACAQVDSMPDVPTLRDGSIRLFNASMRDRL
jgi:2-phosphosulfolactate phosphatase